MNYRLGELVREVKDLEIGKLYQKAGGFEQVLRDTKARVGEPGFWYPYGTLSNLGHLDRLLNGESRSLFDWVKDKPIADIGAADGDFAFFLASLGYQVDIVDHAPTNFNSLRGAQRLREALSLPVDIHDVDLDAQFALPRDRYGLVLFLGILYHLKNPYYALERLSQHSEYCLLSTKIARFSDQSSGIELEHLPVAYLLSDRQANNDPTNFWVFSHAGLKRLFDRTGWQVVEQDRAGDTKSSDPFDMAHDERAFCLLKSTR